MLAIWFLAERQSNKLNTGEEPCCALNITAVNQKSDYAHSQKLNMQALQH